MIVHEVSLYGSFMEILPHQIVVLLMKKSFQAIAQKPAAIVVLAVDGDAVIPAIEKANEAGVPVIARDIAIPLRESVRQLDAVADGDLSLDLPAELSHRRDEVGSMVQALAKMQKALRTVLTEVRQEAGMTRLLAGKP